MQSSHHLSFAIACGLLSLWFARSAAAQTNACSALVVEADAAVLGRWPELPERIRGTFAGRDGIDRCARVRLELRHPALTIEVVLADGRSALRTVFAYDDAIPVLEALLLVPRAETSSSVLQGPTPAPAASGNGIKPVASKSPAQPKGAARHTLSASARETPVLAASEENRALGFELSVFTGARVGDGQTSIGLGALSFLDVGGWLAGFQGRVDDYTAMGSAETQSALELAALLGRRFSSRAMALDLIAGPAVVLQGSYAVRTAGATDARVETSSGVVPRWVFGSHLTFAARSALRAFVGVEGEVGSRGSSSDLPQLARPGMPVWMVGLALGATVGTR